jgi:putative protein-disulfide isomerase
MNATLYYVHDPMCSWCWAFRPTLNSLLETLPAKIRVEKLLGGLAPDTEEPMPEEMRERLQQTWRHIEQNVPGIHFNFDFWRNTTPRRATYPACRAVLAAREQGADEAMLAAIQTAYYQQARNPSDDHTLLELASEIGLDSAGFEQALNSERIQQQLEKEMAQASAIGVDSYPSLVLEVNGNRWPVPIDYLNPANLLANIEWLLGET